MDITNTIVVITGASSPLGRMVALHFAGSGATVAAVDHQPQDLLLTVTACKALNPSCAGFTASGESIPSIEAAFADIEGSLGKFKILVNCWHSLALPSLLNCDAIDQYCALVNSTLTAHLHFGQIAAQKMIDNGQAGVIVNLADVPHSISNADALGTREMIAGLTQSWAKELSPYHIRVGGIVPRTAAKVPMDAHDQVGLLHEMVRNVEYIVDNDYFNGRLIEAQAGE
uniref:SDR family NAD(P)-dependent oxidoreductase n=1 Tax=Thaumasiovibrio occultus TaxID=1891184 RepID=UPI000B352C75|nr:SDR family NAD(P)-dependent oxidoreductase [Thaumasiovibrio occultus]